MIAKKTSPLLIILICMMATLCFSQTMDSSSHNREIVISPLNFSSGATFLVSIKKSKHPNHFGRFSLGVGRFEFTAKRQPVQNENYSKFSFSVTTGKEIRQKLDDKLWWTRGGQLIIDSEFRSIPNMNFASNFSTDINLGLGYILGLYFDVTEKWAFVLETIPTLVTGISTSNGQFRDDFNIGFYVNNYMNLGIVRKFNAPYKKK